MSIQIESVAEVREIPMIDPKIIGAEGQLQLILLNDKYYKHYGQVM
jgi:hypothetical protein